MFIIINWPDSESFHDILYSVIINTGTEKFFTLFMSFVTKNFGYLNIYTDNQKIYKFRLVFHVNLR